ncbi:MAG: prolipoprotein diacylglyceryl transferase [Candidatus Hydrogenedentes bacterium]|nr:prolipoprotein diacylglyceryl transferase [Candidatus Hydrogenedentota bacterium]
MYPTLLKLGIFEFHAYTVFMALAFLIGVLCAVNENYRLEKPYPVTPMGGIVIFFAALFGARAYHIVQYGELSKLYEAFYFWAGGLVFYGGLLGGFIGGVAYVRYKRVPVLPMGDIGLPYLALAHAVARLGCFLNSCCWGSVTEKAWGIAFPRHTLPYAQHLEDGLIARGAEHSLPVHPTQLYESAGLLCIFFILRWRFKGAHHTGEIMLMYPLLYGLLRFTVEAFRGDSVRSAFGMTASQQIALILFLGAAITWVVLKNTRWQGAGEAPRYAEQQ